MAVTAVQVKRRGPAGAAGAPPSLRSGEISYNMADGFFYVGYGDNGQGVATSIRQFAKDDFNINKLLPPGGAAGQVLSKSAAADYSVAWTNPASGGSSNTAGAGIDISATGVISVAASTVNGIFPAASIPNLDAAKIATGTFHVDRIPNHDASKITSGVFDIARIPVLPSSVQITSSGGIGALTAAQQAEIGDGSIVTTTDGRRWVYTGAGSKTLEASYIELADITPEWTAVANKPSFALVATSGAYADLTGLPSLGTMAAQNANAVAITGGTIDNVVIDGGTF